MTRKDFPRATQTPPRNGAGKALAATAVNTVVSADSALPFMPLDATLREVIRKKYLVNVARWLLGRDDDTILAQAGNSAWESALTLIFLAEIKFILAENGEEAALQQAIHRKSISVTNWILEKAVPVTGNEAWSCWENVTWDTSVVIRGLLVALTHHAAGFDESTQLRIRTTVRAAMEWLLHRFETWDAEVKYPFGPADVAQIAIALLHMAQHYPDIYSELRARHHWTTDHAPCVQIVEYLLNRKTEQTLSVQADCGQSSPIVSFWWDDYFSTAEVVEALALFYQFCKRTGTLTEHRPLIQAIKAALIGACTYFEQGQVEGMWGSHIETIRVLNSYILIRRLIPQRETAGADPLIVPEIHTTFKAIRWLCDEKQVFSDGSFLHTLFLTIFYALTLTEVYKSWEPANCRIDKLYDDVVWFSPVRTTPERSKRLAAELQNGELLEKLEAAHNAQIALRRNLRGTRQTLLRIIGTLFSLLVGVPLMILIGSLLQLSKVSAGFKILKMSDFLAYLAVFVTVFIGVLTAIWTQELLPKPDA